MGEDERFAAWHDGGHMIEWVTSCDIIAEMSDADLIASFQRSNGFGAEAQALLAEIERRGLDV